RNRSIFRRYRLISLLFQSPFLRILLPSLLLPIRLIIQSSPPVNPLSVQFTNETPRRVNVMSSTSLSSCTVNLSLSVVIPISSSHSSLSTSAMASPIIYRNREITIGLPRKYKIYLSLDHCTLPL